MRAVELLIEDFLNGVEVPVTAALVTGLFGLADRKPGDLRVIDHLRIALEKCASPIALTAATAPIFCSRVWLRLLHTASLTLQLL